MFVIFLPVTVRTKRHNRTIKISDFCARFSVQGSVITISMFIFLVTLSQEKHYFCIARGIFFFFTYHKSFWVRKSKARTTKSGQVSQVPALESCCEEGVSRYLSLWIAALCEWLVKKQVNRAWFLRRTSLRAPSGYKIVRDKSVICQPWNVFVVF